ncbi:MAG TPA: hypothetical protein VIF64_03415 [Pyrinomonadaceae bacterium]|jgi:hypothetical protein
MPNPKDKQFAEKDNKDLVLARDFGDDCLQYTTDLTVRQNSATEGQFAAG